MVIAFVGTRGIPYQNTRDRNEYNCEIVATQLARRGHSVYVISDPNYTQLTEYKGIHIIPSHPKVKSIIRELRKIEHLDIVHIKSLEYAWVAFWISLQMPQVRVIFDYHQYTFVNNNKNRRNYMLLSYISAQFSDSLIIDNPELEMLLSPSFKSKVYTIPTGIDTNTIVNNQNTFKGLYPQDYILVNNGQYRDSDSLELWLKAYHKHNLNLPIIVLGKVKPSIREAYQSDTILFIGELSGNTEQALIQNAYIFVEISPNNEDKYPVSLALITGIPVLASKGAYNKELIQNTGIFFTPYNYSSIVTGLNIIEDMHPILKRKASEYMPIIQDILSIEGQVHKYLYAYLNTFEAKKARKSIGEPTLSIPVIG
jgi:glycosyltransferase involved in cell wall biosynthesis